VDDKLFLQWNISLVKKKKYIETPLVLSSLTLNSSRTSGLDNWLTFTYVLFTLWRLGSFYTVYIYIYKISLYIFKKIYIYKNVWRKKYISRNIYIYIKIIYIYKYIYIIKYYIYIYIIYIWPIIWSHLMEQEVLTQFS